MSLWGNNSSLSLAYLSFASHLYLRYILASTPKPHNTMPPPINLMRGWPASSLLPIDLIKAAAVASLSNPQIAEAGLSYGPDPGYEPARREIAKWLSGAYARNTLHVTQPENICITGGASQNLGNVLSVYTDPAYTRKIWIVAPAYFLAFRIFEDAGFGGRLRAVAEDEEGLDLEGLERGILESEEEWEVKDAVAGSPRYKPERARAKVYRHVVYCVPSFANPSSASMSLRRRQGLVRLARRFDALLIADDVYDFLHWPVAEPSEAELETASLPPRQILPRLVDVDREIDGGTQRDGADGFGNACSNGSFSKIAGPGVRCGWLEGSEKFAYGVSQT
jgi:DNA-binding transcriptional MocR family regulator